MTGGQHALSATPKISRCRRQSGLVSLQNVLSSSSRKDGGGQDSGRCAQTANARSAQGFCVKRSHLATQGPRDRIRSRATRECGVTMHDTVLASDRNGDELLLFITVRKAAVARLPLRATLGVANAGHPHSDCRPGSLQSRTGTGAKVNVLIGSVGRPSWRRRKARGSLFAWSEMINIEADRNRGVETISTTPSPNYHGWLTLA